MSESGPLAGIRVLEASCFISGPFSAQLLADMGADVIKVEKPGEGDPFRSFAGRQSVEAKMSPHFEACNRNKRSIELDIADEEGRQRFVDLVIEADVLIENFRPGVMVKLGLGYEQLRESAPGLVYCSITGFGQEGPYAQRPAYDAVGLAMSGLASRLLEPENPRLVGPNLSDCITSLTAAYATLGALRHRDHSGQGQHVDVSMLASTSAIMLSDWAMYFRGFGEGTPRSRASRSQSYAFGCADGKIVVVHLSFPEKFWVSLLAAVEREDLGQDPRFDHRDGRVQNFEELQDTLAEVFAKRPREEWLARLREHDVPHAPAYTLGEVLEDPHVQSMGFEVPMTGPDGAQVRGLAPPMNYSATPWGDMRGAPLLGQHTEDVLRDGWRPRR